MVVQQADDPTEWHYIAACAGPAILENAELYRENYTEALSGIEFMIRSCASEASEPWDEGY